MEDEEILTHRRVALIELIQKHIRTRDMLELVTEIAYLLEQWKCSKEHCKKMMYYIALSDNTQNGEKFIQTLAQKAPSYQEELITIEEQLEAKGIQKGKKEGINEGLQKGLERGRKEAILELAKQLLSNGVQYSVVKISTGLTDKELKSLSQKNNQND